MATKALDLVTIGHALNVLADDRLGNCQWRGQGQGTQQDAFLDWQVVYGELIRKLNRLEALAALTHEPLNEFLENRGFEAQFRPFRGVGVASVLDMLVEWAIPGETTTVSHYSHEQAKVIDYPAFELSEESTDVYAVDGHTEPLVRLRTKSGDSLWLTVYPEPESGLHAALTAQQLAAATHVNTWAYAGATVPMLEIDVRPDLTWLPGLYSFTPNRGVQSIAEAFQQFKLRANEVGARVKVATGLVARGFSLSSGPYTLDRPFLGWFTQAGHDQLALAAFWADTDSWKTGDGTLEEL